MQIRNPCVILSFITPMTKQSTPLGYLSLNIEGSKHLELVETLIRKHLPDIVTLQEVHEQDVPRLAEARGYAHRFESMASYTHNESGIAMRKGLLIMWEHSLVLEDLQAYPYVIAPDAEDASVVLRGPNQRNRILLVAELMKDGKQYRFATTHFTWTHNSSVDDAQREGLKKLLAILSRYDDERGVILSGDFNAPRGREIWDTLARKYHDNIPEDIETTLDQTLHRVKGLMCVVDGLFTTLGYTVSDVEIVDGVSDHKAILVKIATS